MLSSEAALTVKAATVSLLRTTNQLLMLNDKNEQLIYQSHIRVETDLNAIANVLKWFEQFNRPPVVYELWVQGQIALVEGFTNAVRHAHKCLPQQTPIDLTVKIFSYQVEIYIWDQGPPFDLEALLNEVDWQHLAPLEREAHWGAILMQKLKNKYNWMIYYTCSTSLKEQRNCLLMRKTFS